jgi:diacylglycerol kinase (ATP)
MKPDILVIVNPAAGGGRARRVEPRIAAYLSASRANIQFVHSQSSEDIRSKAARAAAEGCRYVVALGGDGAFHHVVEGVRGTDAIAGFFPAGNGNDIAGPLGIPADAMRSAEAFLHSKPRLVDLVRVSFRDGRTAHFIGAGGMGLDAEAAHLANTRFRKWPGVTRYLAGALWSFSHEQPIDLHATLDGEHWSGRALFAAIANGTSYGAGVVIAPDAKMDDGWLDAVLVGELGWLRLLRAIPIALTSGNLQRFKEVHRFRCRRAVLETDRPVKVHGDGELLGESPAEFEILPGAIRVMAPSREEDNLPG